MCIEIFLFAKLGKQNADLVRDVADGLVVCGFAPVGELACDGKTFLACSFVALNEVILGLYELVELLAQLGLDGAAEGAKAEAVAAG